MTLSRPLWVGFSLVVLLAGCASTPNQISTDSAHWVDPISSGRTTTTGWLVARVEGSPRNIEYFLNGVRLEPESRIEWWKDAFIRLELRPGFYELEARYDVRAFAGRGIPYRIRTRHPIEIRAGLETEVEANLEKDWRGVPANEIAYFAVVTPERRARKDAATQRALAGGDDVAGDGIASGTRAGDGVANKTSFSSAAVPLTVDPKVTPEILEEVRLSDALAAAAATDQIVIHGNESASGSGTVRIQSAQDAQPVSTAPDNISIIGSEDTSSPVIDELAPAAAALGAGTAATLSIPETSKNLAPEPASPAVVAQPVPYTLEGSEEFGITVHIESVPSGARVIVDEQVVGQTPVQVRMDPRADHIVEFMHDGCGDYVRLLSSTSWRDGRDTTVQVQLYCD